MQARSEQTHRLILENAAEIIRAEGLHACTHRALAAAVGVSPGTITWHFKSLDALYAAVIEDAVTSFAAQAQQWFAQRDDAPPAAQLAGFLFWTLAQPERLLSEYALFVAAVSRPRLRPAAASWLETHARLLQARFAISRPRADTLVAFTDAWLLRSVICGDRPMPAYAAVEAAFSALLHGPD